MRKRDPRQLEVPSHLACSQHHKQISEPSSERSASSRLLLLDPLPKRLGLGEEGDDEDDDEAGVGAERLGTIFPAADCSAEQTVDASLRT
mmetsp:Transcript_7816/g.21244  ORF Transcript_7816/g.21244 Transcript_7816/m.21244 type:complete len:90 (+) Transcript_7816:88-357(+)